MIILGSSYQMAKYECNIKFSEEMIKFVAIKVRKTYRSFGVWIHIKLFYRPNYILILARCKQRFISRQYLSIFKLT